jgi:hypothetical protein
VTELAGLPEAAGRLTASRFVLVSFLPTYAAVLTVGFFLAAGAPGPVDAGTALDRLDALSAGQLVLLGLVVLLLAVVLHPLQLPLVQVLEGYWPERPARPGQWCRERQERRRARLVARTRVPAQGVGAQQAEQALVAAWQLSRRFPPEGRPLMPTALGNVLRATEARAGAAYGADTVTWWPRLYPQLGERVRAVVDDRRDQLDLVCRLSVTALVSAVVTAGLLARSGWWLVVPLVLVGLCVVAYRAAVSSAVAFGEAVSTSFDLHRFDLLTALHLPLPADPAAERLLNERLSRFWSQGVPLAVHYAHGDPHPAEDAPRPAQPATTTAKPGLTPVKGQSTG